MHVPRHCGPWTLTICDGCGQQVGVIGHAGRCDPASESEIQVVPATPRGAVWIARKRDLVRVPDDWASRASAAERLEWQLVELVPPPKETSGTA